MSNNNMKVYVTTCDAYRHLIPGFAYMFNKYWDCNQEVVVLCHKKPQNTIPDNFTIHSMGKEPENMIWTNDLIKYFSNIEDDYFVLMMEDCYIIEKVNLDYIKTLEKYFDNPDIVKIDLTNDRIINAKYTEYDKIGDLEIVESYSNSMYRSSLQAAIWRREYFLKLLKPNRNPWEFELLGGKEAIYDGYGGIILGTKNHIVKNIEVMCKQKFNYRHDGIPKIPTKDLIDMRKKNIIFF